VVAETVDGRRVEGEAVLGADPDAQLTALTAVGGDQERIE
jgi:hypothetical protein